MESYNRKRLNGSSREFDRYKIGVVKFTTIEHYSKYMRGKFEVDYRKNSDRFSTSVEDGKFVSLGVESFFNRTNFYPVILVVANTKVYESFWMNKEEIENFVIVNNEYTGTYQGKEIIGSSEHYSNGNFLGHYRSKRYRYAYISIFVPNEITEKNDIINYFKSELKLADMLNQYNIDPLRDNETYLSKRFSKDRIDFYYEVNHYMHYVGKIWAVLDKLCK